MFNKILIANRGEIACRVAATARRLGIRTVAVYSEADAHARHVQACDEAVAIGGAAPRDSYLRADRILAAARATGAQAVHPGYGFLSENEAFARACAEAGIAFIGPPPAAIAAMGSKSAAKALMAQAGVPLVPGYHGADNDPALLATEAARIGYPVLIKASAGGGGKGMRRVDAPQDFAAALASCQREAQASFGDQHVLVERYVLRPRHIEIQVFADSLGHCIHLGERDCSVQRRHQKVLEESPAPGLSAARRAEMGAAAVAAAQAVGYVGAGTVEFIAEEVDDGDLRFYFMEMNTRLQVEHPVTEAVTGQDLVDWQLRVAAGQPLPLTQEQVQLSGHAIEARLCAENPDAGFLPATGQLDVLRWPAHAEFERGAVRVDAGVREGDAISPHYDSMIAKLIVWGDTRAQALARLDQALQATRIVGLATNAAFLRRVVQCSSFATADLDTGLIERERAVLLDQPALPLAVAAAGVVAHQLAAEAALEGADPFSRRDGWRLHGGARRHVDLEVDGQAHSVALARHHDGRCELQIVDQRWPITVRALGGAAHDVTLGEQRLRFEVFVHGERVAVFAPAGSAVLRVVDAIAHAGEAAGEGGRLTAPMPGKVVAFLAAAGDRVAQGQPLAVMEAMKMEHTLTAPRDGVVAELLYGVGDQVAEGGELLRLEPVVA
ncbi:acetyl/propionyl/methylcrotonyl-CoA carboxylase subunit alpha [Aquabacterium sp. OR-4]|uniref:acetyl/propionyl/methylcrotonyl-CoA carboxylase subunit alpha n=1 Tax=Aquabacterium sp. OR-4 TaxID=2978127 RepID=UPI0021B1B6CE|nr:biotin carboxylase N-terminal domain-containing protein [Aquabacterium sp. OR-4]MDT7837396.1 biotin carboxylase N-terminal domain-containing protein [Aquabacterium sp. OR-4]